jgi:hypothetical protein
MARTAQTGFLPGFAGDENRYAEGRLSCVSNRGWAASALEFRSGSMKPNDGMAITDARERDA